MNWFKELYKGEITKWITFICLIGGPAFELGQYCARKWVYGIDKWHWDAIFFTYGLFAVVFIMSFLYRNAE